MTHTKLISSLFAACALWANPIEAAKRIVTVMDAPFTSHQELFGLFQMQIGLINGADCEVAAPLVGDWSEATAKKLLESAAQSDADIILTIGPVTSNVAARKESPKPLVACFGFEPNLLAAKNVTAITLPVDIADQLLQFQSLRSFSRTAVFVHEALFTRLSASLPGSSGLTLVRIPADCKDLVPYIPEGCESCYLTPLFLPDTTIASFANACTKRNILTFSYLGGPDVDAGILAARTWSFLSRDEAKQPATIQVAKAAGLAISQINSGRTPKVKLPERDTLAINVDTAEALSLSLSATLRLDAHEVRSRTRDIEVDVDIQALIDEAIANNSGFLADLINHHINVADVDAFKSNFKPHIEISTTSEGVKRKTFPLAQTTAYGFQAQVTQLIYSAEAFFGIDAAKRAVLNADLRSELYRNSLIQATLNTVLDVAKQEALSDIQLDTNERLRSTYEVSRNLVHTQALRAAALDRVRTTLASHIQSLSSLSAAKELAQTKLNQIVGRDLTQSFGRLRLDDRKLVPIEPAALEHITKSPGTLERLMSFETQRALDFSKELALIENALATLGLNLDALKKSLFIPDLAAQATANTRMTGRHQLALPAKDDRLSFGIGAIYPLNKGGLTNAKMDKARQLQHQLRMQRADVASKIGLRVRANMQVARAALDARALATESERSAKNALEKIENSYQNGEATVLDMIDAQNGYHTARSKAVEARFAFLNALVDTQAAVGRFAVLETPEQNRQWTQSIKSLIQRD